MMYPLAELASSSVQKQGFALYNEQEWKMSLTDWKLWEPLFQSLKTLGQSELDAFSRKTRGLFDDDAPLRSDQDTAEHERQGYDPIPHLLSEEDFMVVEKGLEQRATLLNAILKDCYLDQELLKSGQLPPELLFNTPKYNRALVKQVKDGDEILSFYAADLMKNEAGEWFVVQDYTNSPEGLGKTLKNRIATSDLFSDLAKDQGLMRLSKFFRSYQKSIHDSVQSGVDTPLVVMLSGRRDSPTYLEDAYLAQYLGVPLVDGSELTVREERVHLKTVSDLMRVHVIIRRMDETITDPLTSPVSSCEGVPGLMQAMQAGTVRVLNPSGTGILEVSELYSYLPSLCDNLLKAPLLLPSARASEIVSEVIPVWNEKQVQKGQVTIRFFAIYDGERYRVMPGGLGTYQLPDTTTRTKDVWVVPSEQAAPAEFVSMLNTEHRIKRTSGLLSSRAADNLYWIGRYSNRVENATRIVLEIVLRITEEQERSGERSHTFLLNTLQRQQFLPASEDNYKELAQNQPALLGTLSKLFFIQEDKKIPGRDSIPMATRSLHQLAAISQARLSTEMLRTVHQMEHLSRAKPVEDFIAFRNRLREMIYGSTAFSGACFTNLTRTRGWHFIIIGKSLENINWLTTLTVQALEEQENVPTSTLESLLSINDSILTYRFRYQGAPQLLSVLDLVLYDPANPRSLYTQLHEIKNSLLILVDREDRFNSPVLNRVKKALTFLETELLADVSLADRRDAIDQLIIFLKTLNKEVSLFSDQLGWEFFTHVNYQSL